MTSLLLLVVVLAAPPAESESPMNASPQELPDLPQAIASFGAARHGEAIFVQGGHHGAPHHYSQAGQSGQLLRLDLRAPTAWRELASEPKLQGQGMVAHGRHLYRIGGFTARNPEGEKQDLWSVAEVARFDPAGKQWEALPPLPTPRSSFDAVLIDDTIYVVGGWELRGGEETRWPDTALALTLTEQPLAWREIPQPPFQRRALALGTVGGKLYAIGGMTPDGKITRATALYDPASRTWSEGPTLPEGEMEGFGSACCTLGDRLYVSTITGKLLRLADDGKTWQLVKALPEDRFFHRMLPLDERRLVLVGGASMKSGKFASLTIVDVEP